MNFSKDFGNIGASYGDWQKYAGLGDKFAQEITAFPADKAPVAPPGVDYETQAMAPVDYSLAANKSPVGLGVAPTNTFGLQPTVNQGFVAPLQAPNLFDSVKDHYGVK